MCLLCKISKVKLKLFQIRAVESTTSAKISEAENQVRGVLLLCCFYTMAKVGMKGGKEGERKKIKFKKKVPKKVKTQENIEQLKSQYGEINSKTVKSFQDLPLSKETLAGLKAGR